MRTEQDSRPAEGMLADRGLPRTAIIGATGFMGRFFLKAYRTVYPDCIGTSRKPDGDNIFKLDLLSPNIAPLGLNEKKYREALVLAAKSRLAECEEDRESTRKVNVEGTLALVRHLVDEGIKPIFSSSDNVFDGKTGRYSDDAPRNPVTEYGRQKAEVEERIGEITGGDHLIVRLGKTFSLQKGDGTLLDEMTGILASGGTVRAAYDQILNPTLIDDLIRAVSALQIKGARGTVNVCSPEIWSRYDIAVETARALGVDTGKVMPISIDELGFGPKRPKNGSMLIDRLARETGCTFTPLKRCIGHAAANWKD